MNNNQNEQAQVSTNEQTTQGQQTPTTKTKAKKQKKPLFQEDTFLYKITYGFTAKVKSGEISFAKVFWFGVVLKIIVGYTLLLINSRQLMNLDTLYIFFWMKYMWHARKSVYHPFWFYLGFCTPILWTAYGVYQILQG